MSWPVPMFSWTKGRWDVTTVPADKTKSGVAETYDIYVHGGPFIWFEDKWFIKKFYFGFRPTPPWPIGYGNEGDGIFGNLGRWLKRKNMGNLGFALRFKKEGE